MRGEKVTTVASDDLEPPTMTMTHSDKVTNGGQKPRPTDTSVGVITPHKKTLLNLKTVRCQQGEPLLHC